MSAEADGLAKAILLEFQNKAKAKTKPELDPVLLERTKITMVGDLKETEVEWLVDEFLEVGSIGLIIGGKGTWKSFLALDCAMQVAITGKHVLIVSAEGVDMDRRIDAWLKYHNSSKTRKDLKIGLIERRLDMTNKDVLSTISYHCKVLKLVPALIVLDTYSKLRKHGGEENSNDDAKEFVDAISNWKHPKTSVLVVAHEAKSNPGKSRGGGALEDDTETGHVVTKTGLDTISVSRERYKQTASLPLLHLKAVPVDLGRVDKKGVPVKSLVLVPCNSPLSRKGLGVRQSALLATLDGLGSVSQEQLDELLDDMPPSKRKVLLDSLKGAKHIIADGHDRWRSTGSVLEGTDLDKASF